jgi:hypothetical protein
MTESSIKERKVHVLIYIHNVYVYVEGKGSPVRYQAGTERRCRCIALPILEIGARKGWLFNAIPRPLYHQEGDWYPLQRRLCGYVDDIIIIKEVDFTKYQVEIARRRTVLYYYYYYYINTNFICIHVLLRL